MTRILYSLKEAAALLSMCEKTLRKHIAAGNIPTVRDGHSYKLRHKDLERFASQDRIESVYKRAS